MIIDLKKYLFIGIQKDLEQFFNRAQEQGYIEFIAKKGRKVADFPKPLQEILSAIKILRRLSKEKSSEFTHGKDPLQIAEKVIKAHTWLEKLLESERLLKAELSRIRPFGYFSLEEISELEKETGRHFQFFCMKRLKIKKAPPPPELIFLKSEDNMNYYLSISHKVESYPEMIEIHLEKSLSYVESELEKIKESIEQCKSELKKESGYLSFLEEKLLYFLDKSNLQFALSDVTSHMDEALFAIEGWVPKNELPRLSPLLKGLGVMADEIAVSSEDRVPTHLLNQGVAKIGEDLVQIYDTPATIDKDPSTWVFWSFVLFFAMIMSDAGYGIIYLLAGLLFKWKLPNVKSSLKRFFRLIVALGISTIIWGVIAGSYFGITFSPSSLIGKSSLVQYLAVKKAAYHMKEKDHIYQEWVQEYPYLKEVTSPLEFLERGVTEKEGVTTYVVLEDFKGSVLMEFSLLAGILHISLSLLRFARRRYPSIGWVLAILGGYLYFPFVMKSISIIQFMNILPPSIAKSIGFQLLWWGMAVAFFFALVQHKWKGLMEISKPIEIFADVLSYLRLYALGLAGMILATTFNTMAKNAGLLAGLIVILLGHMCNIFVSIMGGVIHGLRLNFIEWYHHSFEGGGRLFNPLRFLYDNRGVQHKEEL